jgi:D-sedoheptulose 7-phosphate isomerase
MEACPLWIRHLASLLIEVEVTGAHGDWKPLEAALDRAAVLLVEARNHGRKVMVVGNGGSAAIASHVQTDLSHGLGIRSLLFTEPSILTAQANDHGYEHAFENLVNLWADPGDLLIAISSSGRSPNILTACRAGMQKGASLLTLSGFSPGNPLRGMGAINFYVPSSEYGAVESAHAVLLHRLTDLVLAEVRP